ncbi:MAG: PEP-CTERM system TPR-repeat protein PrsT [Burkholderiales bacterium]|nr:PEP-CTERM system TPR-repeat protein PrsT [Burkholderiales bacterium]
MSRYGVVRAIAVLSLVVAVAGCGRNDPQKFIASAEGYVEKANYPAAVIELKNALAGAPDNAKARFLLGKALLATGDANSAATELRKALALAYPTDEVYPQLARAWLLQGAPKGELEAITSATVSDPRARADIANTLALAYLSYGRVKEARAQADMASSLDAASLPIRLTQARLLAAENDRDGAMQKVSALLADSPDNVEALAFKSELETLAGQRAAAARTLEKLVALRPQALQMRYMLATTYIQLREIDKAAKEAEALKKQAPKDARTLHAAALVAFAKEDIPAALEAVQRSLQAAPDYLPARYLSGLIDLRRGAYESAEQSLRTVLGKSPDESGARIALAQTLLRRGSAAKAQELLEPALRRSPDDVAALRLAAEIELAQQRADKASKYIARANELEEDNLRGRVRLAQVRLAKGETEEGIRELESLAVEPDKRDADVALIHAHLKARNYDKALAAADALIKKQPKSAFAYNAKGTVYAAKRDMVNARASYDKALSVEPGYPGALFNLASLDALERKYDDARKRYEQVLVKDPKSDRALLGLVQLEVVANAPAPTLLAAIQRAIAANPQSVAARMALIAFHAKQKDFRAAIDAAQAGLAANPEAPPILEALASLQLVSGEKNQALETYARITKLQPENPLPMMRAAGIHASLKNYEPAIALLRNALAVAPNNAGIWIALAAVYVESGRVEAGLAEARRLQNSATTRTAGYALEGEIDAAQKKIPEAVAAYRSAVSRANVPQAVIRLHSLLVAFGKPDEAAAVVQKWIAEHPKDVAVRAYVGSQSLAKGDAKTAATYLRAALDVEPENLTLLNDLAWALAQSKDPKAVDYAQRAYGMAPNNPAVVNTYGWALVQRGDNAQGLQMLRRAVDLDPSDAGRRLYLARALIQAGDKPAARKELEVVAKADAAPLRSQAEQLLKDL